MARTTKRCMPRCGRPPRGACCAVPLTPAGTALVTNSRSPQITGVELPRPGSGTFQTMFFVSLQVTGGFAVVETPLKCGPRHCGQKRSASAAWLETSANDPRASTAPAMARAAALGMLAAVGYVGDAVSAYRAG